MYYGLRYSFSLSGTCMNADKLSGTRLILTKFGGAQNKNLRTPNLGEG